MKYDWETADRIKCNRSERQELVSTIDLIYQAAAKARREGLLALEDDIDEYPNSLFRTGMQLVVDGTDPGIIEAYLNARILSENARGKALLEQMLVADGVLSIQSGDNPHLIMTRCFAFLGEDADELHDDYLMNQPDQTDAEFAEAYKNADGSVEACFAETRKLLRFDDRAIQKLLRETDMSPLISVLHGAESEVRKLVLRNMSRKAATMLIMSSSANNARATEDAVKANVTLLFDTVQMLIDAGEITARD